MSLILEALKKSEAERRLGETPNLGTVPGWAPPPRASRAWWLLPLVLIAIGAGWSNRDLISGKPIATDEDATITTKSTMAASADAALVADRDLGNDPVASDPAADALERSASRDPSGPSAPFARRDGPSPTSARPSQPMPDPIAALQGRDAIVTVDATVAAGSSGQGADDAVLPESPPPSAGIRSRDDQIASEAAKMVERSERMRALQAARVAAAGGQQPGAAQPEAQQPTNQQPFPAASTASNRDQSQMPIADRSMPAQPVYSSAPQAPAKDPTSGMAAAGLTLNDLSLGQRQGLPPLKMSVHFYNKDPARRFVIIDGARLNEGGAIGSDVYLRQIVADGVMLEYRGVQFLLPRLGG